MLLVAFIVDPTARVYSFEAPTDLKETVGTPTPATNSMPRQRLRSIYRAFRARFLIQCCSWAPSKNLFQQTASVFPRLRRPAFPRSSHAKPPNRRTVDGRRDHVDQHHGLRARPRGVRGAGRRRKR